MRSYPLWGEQVKKSGLYLGLFHGRHTLDERLDDWGFNGPLIGPLQYVHTTYGWHIKLQFVVDSDALKYGLDPDFPELKVAGDCVEFQGKYYGDWSTAYFNSPFSVPASFWKIIPWDGKAEVRDEKGDTVCFLGNHSDGAIPSQKSRANAKLVAAAPLLLKACILALDREDVADSDLGDLLREVSAVALNRRPVSQELLKRLGIAGQIPGDER